MTLTYPVPMIVAASFIMLGCLQPERVIRSSRPAPTTETPGDKPPPAVTTDDPPPAAPASSATKESSGGSPVNLAVSPVAPSVRQSEPVATAPTSRRSDSFPCGKGVRCRAGQVCCPGVEKVCIEDGEICESPETGIGFRCDEATQEPCSAGQTCVVGKMGAGPFTITSECQ
jgi:hypothetical protein